MMLLFLVSCLAHKTTLTGVIDYVHSDHCAVELNTGEIVQVKSDICLRAKEGDIIFFYIRKK